MMCTTVLPDLSKRMKFTSITPRLHKYRISKASLHMCMSEYCPFLHNHMHFSCLMTIVHLGNFIEKESLFETFFE